MSKSAKKQKNLNDFIKKNLSNQQKLIKEKYEKNQNDSNNKDLLSIKNINDYHYELLYNINSNSDELPQYSTLYLKRLEMTKKKLLEDCKKKWPKVHICKNILDLKGNVIIIFIINIFYILERADYHWTHL